MPAELQAKIEGWALEGRSASDIERLLAEAGVHPWERPSRRTIQRIVHEAKVLDRSGPWSLADAEGDDATVILPVYRAYLNITAMSEPRMAKPWFLTKAQARWIVKVARATSDLGPINIYRLARAYLGREVRQQPMYDLDALIAFTPWDETPRRNSSGFEYTMREAYQKGVRGGTIPAAPQFLMMELAGMPMRTPTTKEMRALMRAKYEHDPDAYEDATVLEEGDGEEG